MKKLLKLIISIVGCEIIGVAATPFTLSAIPTWYSRLNKPSFSPPNWIFGPVWTVLYLTMGISLYFVWRKKPNKKIRIALLYFLMQLTFNFIWSILFFGFRSPILGIIDIVVLWVAILLTIIKFYKIEKISAWLLVPYLFWVSFATVLNFSILILNH